MSHSTLDWKLGMWKKEFMPSCSLDALSFCSSMNKDWKEERYKWKTDHQSLWVCCNHTEKAEIAEGQMGNPMLHIERPCKDAWRILNIPFHIQQMECKTCSNKLPSFLPSVSKIFRYPEMCLQFQLLYNHPSLGEKKKFELKKHRSSAKFPPSGDLMEIAIFCLSCDIKLTTDDNSAVTECSMLVFWVMNIVFMSNRFPAVIHCHIYEVSYDNIWAAWSHVAVHDIVPGPPPISAPSWLRSCPF